MPIWTSPRSGAMLATLVALGLVLCGAPGRALADPPPTMAGCDLVPVADPETVFVVTPLGTLEIELYSNVAPVTVANFLGYIARGDYQGSVFHRLAPGFVIQAGGFRFRDDRIFDLVETQDPIVNEPCLSNVERTIAMAKLEDQPDSATSQWFVNLVDNSANLDFQNGGFTVFGRVIGDGLDVANAIAVLPDRMPESPIPPFLAGVPVDRWPLFRALPLTEPLGDIDPADYGCFDPEQAGVVLVEEPTSETDWEPNPALELAFTLASRACETALPGSPSFPCQAPGRRVVRVDPDGAPEIDPDAEFGFAEDLVSCEGLAASEASYLARIEDLVEERLPVVRTAYFVPEPGTGVAGLAALAAVAALRRRPRDVR